jgi:hypothetical protein
MFLNSRGHSKTPSVSTKVCSHTNGTAQTDKQREQAKTLPLHKVGLARRLSPDKQVTSRSSIRSLW